MGKLADKLRSGAKVITAEITPPKGAGTKKFLKHAELLGPVTDAINVTDCQRALVKMSSLAAARVLLDAGCEPVYQLTCRDRNSIALQSDLMGASALGIPNLLCLTGDPVKVGDNPDAKSVFELEAVKLLELVGKLQSGRDGTGEKMNLPTKFFVGAVLNPTLQSNQLARVQKKIEAGAQFFQTQANYDNDDFRSFLLSTRGLPAHFLAGILILHSAEIAAFVHANIPGIRMPEDVLRRYQEAPDAREVGIEIAAETMLKLDDACDGFHLMTVREEDLIPDVLERYHAKRKASQNSPAPVPSAIGR